MGILNTDLIAIDVDLENAEDCIRFAAEMFRKQECVMDGYAEAVAEREKVYPTGLPGKGINIAIPHTDNKFVKKAAIAVIIPKKPIQFTMMGTSDQVLECELIIPLVIQDSDAKISILRKMMKIIQNSELLINIRNSKCKEEIMTLLSDLTDSLDS